MKNLATFGWDETLRIAYEIDALLHDYLDKYYDKPYVLSRLSGLKKHVYELERDIKLSATCAALSYSMLEYVVNLIELTKITSYVMPKVVIKELETLTEMSGEHAEFESYNAYVKGLYDSRHDLDDEWIDKFFSAL